MILDENQLEKIAAIGVRIALNKLCIDYNDCNFTADMKQAAMMKIWQISKKIENIEYPERYLKKVAMNASLDEYFKLRFEVKIHERTEGNTLVILSDVQLAAQYEENTPILEESIGMEKLIEFFYENRKKRGERGLRAAIQDANICILIERSCDNATIADILNISKDYVKQTRYRIRRKLEEINENDS